MSLVFTRLPEKDIFPPTIKVRTVSRWNSAWNPYIFFAQRRDFEIGAIIQLSVAKVQITGLNTPESDTLVVGETIRIIIGPYNEAVTIKRVVRTSQSYFFDIDVDYKGSATNGYAITNIKGWRVEVQLIDPAQNRVIGAGDYRNDIKGDVTVKVNSIVTPALKLQNDFDYSDSSINKADHNLFGRFIFQYRIRKRDETFLPQWITLDTQPDSTFEYLEGLTVYYYVNGAFQLGHVNSGNYIRYVPMAQLFNTLLNVYAIYQVGKWLTKFDRPTKFDGYPMCLSFIWGDKLWTSLRLRGVVDFIESNQANITIEQDLKLTNDQTSPVNALEYLQSNSNFAAINRVNTSFGGASFIGNGFTAKELTVSIRTLNTFDPSAYTEDVYISNIYVATSTPDQGEVEVVEPLIMDYQPTCDNRPEVYLGWLNSLGGFDYWLFYGDFQDNEIIKHETYQRPIFDINTEHGNKRSLSKEAFTELKIGAQSLTNQQIEGLRDLFTSPLVYQMQKDGSRQIVIVDERRVTIKESAKHKRQDVEFSIELPNKYLPGRL